MIGVLKSRITQIIIVAMLAMAAVVAVPALTSAQANGDPNIQGSLCSGAANLQFGEPGDCQTNEQETEDKVNNLVSQIINIFSVVVGIVAVIMIIIGGFRYITSGGDSGNVTGAKNTILYAIIGLIIVALAQFIVKFILSKATTT